MKDPLSLAQLAERYPLASDALPVVYREDKALEPYLAIYLNPSDGRLYLADHHGNLFRWSPDAEPMGQWLRLRPSQAPKEAT